MSIKFGREQLRNPTPANINFWIRLYTVVAGCFMGWMQTATFIPNKWQAIISSIMGLTIAIGNGVAPMFGVPIAAQSVPTDQVSAIETDKK